MEVKYLFWRWLWKLFLLFMSFSFYIYVLCIYNNLLILQSSEYHLIERITFLTMRSFRISIYVIQYLYQTTDQESQDVLLFLILAKVLKLENISKKDNKWILEGIFSIYQWDILLIGMLGRLTGMVSKRNHKVHLILDNIKNYWNIINKFTL